MGLRERSDVGLQPSWKANRHAYAGSFNSTVRLECLGQHWFLDPDDAREKVENWCREYNELRSHSAIGDRPPMCLIHRDTVLRLPSRRKFSSELVQLLGCAKTARGPIQPG